MVHLRNNRTLWSAAGCPLLHISMIISVPPGQKQRKSIWCSGGGQTWWFYFTYLLHAGNNLHAAHTLDVVKISSQRLLDALSFSGDIQFETMFSLWMANFSITITHVSMTRDVFCLPADFFSRWYSRAAFRGWKHSWFWLICGTENGMKGLGHCLMQVVNYSRSNEI